jgi:hypothetical protein
MPRCTTQLIITLRKMNSEAEALAVLMPRMDSLFNLVQQQEAKTGLEAINEVGRDLDLLTETHRIKSGLTRAKRALRGPILIKRIIGGNQTVDRTT